MSKEMRASIRLTDAQLEHLRSVTDGGERNFPEGYRLIHSWIEEHLAARRDGTTFWFEQAAGVNQTTSLSASFIRRHTENGLNLADIPREDRLPMQRLSDLIAEEVIKDVLRERAVEPLPIIISKDIRVALDQGSVKLGGWGGSFYYWDQPFSNNPDKGFPRNDDGTYKTIGQEITRLGQRDLLIDASALTIKQMMIAGEIGWRDVPEMFVTSRNAGMPRAMQAEVTAKATVMVADHVRERTREEIEAFPGELQQLLERQRDRMLEDIPGRLRDRLTPELPQIPRLGAAASEPSEIEDAARLQQLTAHLDAALTRERALAQTPSQTHPVPAHAQAHNVAPDLRDQQATAPAQPGPPHIPDHLRDFRHAGHPLHGQYEQVLTAVHAMEDRTKVAHGSHSERLAAALTEQLSLQRLEPRPDWPFKRFQQLGEVALRDNAIVAIEHDDRFVGLPSGRELRLPVEQATARSVEQVVADWSRHKLPHLHQPQVALAEQAAPAIDPRTLSQHDWRRPEHARNGQYEDLRRQVADAYAQVGVPRTEAQLEQATAAVGLSMQRQQLTQADFVRLQPDAQGVVGPGSPIGVYQHDPAVHHRTAQAPAEALQQAPDVSYQQVQQAAMQQANEHQQREAQRAQTVPAQSHA